VASDTPPTPIEIDRQLAYAIGELLAALRLLDARVAKIEASLVRNGSI